MEGWIRLLGEAGRDSQWQSVLRISPCVPVLHATDESRKAT